MEKIPCEDCITLPICKGKVTVDELGYKQKYCSLEVLIDKCVLVKFYLGYKWGPEFCEKAFEVFQVLEWNTNK